MNLEAHASKTLFERNLVGLHHQVFTITDAGTSTSRNDNIKYSGQFLDQRILYESIKVQTSSPVLRLLPPKAIESYQLSCKCRLVAKGSQSTSSF